MANRYPHWKWTGHGILVWLIKLPYAIAFHAGSTSAATRATTETDILPFLRGFSCFLLLSHHLLPFTPYGVLQFPLRYWAFSFRDVEFSTELISAS
jgi:hypothetical protein